ncbi:glycoside-pentoside-hexuronide (GPH):cation symporter [Paenibacillus motobuensis]|uniref:MFS transporter n=1 Tax=Paenibacillus motobuensis TaxID=295324 RepID=A0ABN0YLM9_9BACL
MEIEKIRFREKLGYGFGEMAGTLHLAAISTFLTFFYTDVVGISAAAVGTLLLVARVFDGFVDIGVGTLIDRTKSKHGKARPWLLWLAIPFGIASILLFSAPDLGPTGALAYAYATYLIVNILYSGINIPYGVMNSLITQDTYQRSLLNIFRMLIGITGTLIISTMTLPLVEAFGGGKGGWLRTFTIFGSVSMILIFITFRSTKERVKPSVVNKDIPLKRSIKALFRNKYWFMMLLVMTCYGIYGASGAAVNVFYAQYILHNKDLVGLFGVLSLIPIVLGLLVISPVIKKFGKRNTMIIGLIISIIGSSIMIIDPVNLPIVITSLVIRSIGMVPVAASGYAMLADTIDYGEWKTGIRTEGLVYSAGSFGGKVGNGIGAALVGWLLAIGGYVGGQATISASASASIQFMFIYLPIIFNVILLIVLIPYKLDKEYPQIIEDLKTVRCA